MAHQALTQAETSQAFLDIKDGNLLFRVTRGEVAASGAQHLLIWSRLATRRKPNFVHRTLSVGGTPTKFGNDVFYSLLALYGVEPSLDEMNRQLIDVYVEPAALSSEGPMPYQRMGLPLEAAVTIQGMVARHSPRGWWR